MLFLFRSCRLGGLDSFFVISFRLFFFSVQVVQYIFLDGDLGGFLQLILDLLEDFLLFCRHDCALDLLLHFFKRTNSGRPFAGQLDDVKAEIGFDNF